MVVWNVQSSTSAHIPMHVSLPYLVIFGTQYLLITSLLYGIDLHRRWKMERGKPVWMEAKYFPSWTHCRFTLLYLAGTVLIFNYMIVTNPIAQLSLDLLGWAVLLGSDWLVSVKAAAIFLMIKYQVKRNPYGSAIAIAGCVIYIINLALFFIANYIAPEMHDASPDSSSFSAYPYQTYLCVQFILYLAVSVALEVIYFEVSFVFVFGKDASVCAGIYGFLDGFVRPLFRSVYCGIKYSIVTLILCASLLARKASDDAVNDTGSAVAFYSYVVPILLQVWLVAAYLTMRRNRPHAPLWIELKMWRPFVEFFWRYAVRRYNGRNTVPLRRNVEWADATTLEKNRKQLESIGVKSKKNKTSAVTRNTSGSKSKSNMRGTLTIGGSAKKIEVQDEEALPEEENE